MKRSPSDGALRCSFCRKSQDIVSKLIATPGDYPKSYICDECVLICTAILDEERSTKSASGGFTLLKPQEIKDKLDQFVIGQHAAKKRLSVAVYNHYKRTFIQHPRHTAARWRNRCRGPEIEHPADRPDRYRQDAAGPDPGEDSRRALRHHRRHHADRGPVTSERMSRTSSSASCKRRTGMSAEPRRASSTSTRSTS